MRIPKAKHQRLSIGTLETKLRILNARSDYHIAERTFNRGRAPRPNLGKARPGPKTSRGGGMEDAKKKDDPPAVGPRDRLGQNATQLLELLKERPLRRGRASKVGQIGLVRER